MKTQKYIYRRKSKRTIRSKKLKVKTKNIINGRDINGRDINSRDIINGRDINGRDINSRDINSRDINSRDIINGGAIKIDDTKTTWEAINKMINVKGATLKDISYSSLSGFIFKMDIPENTSEHEFITFNEITKQYDKPVYSLIFKLAIIGSDNQPRLHNIYYNTNNKGINKQSEYLKDYENEYNVQNKIYFSTLNPNGSNICPSAIGIEHLNGMSVLDFLSKLYKISTTLECKRMLSFFKKFNFITNTEISLGVIAMEFVDDNKYKLLKVLRDEVKKGTDVSIYENNCLYALAELIVLFIKLKIINYDCHSGNIFGNTSGGRPLLIDFGRIVNLNDDMNNSLMIEQYNHFFTPVNASVNNEVHDDDFDEEDSATIIDNPETVFNRTKISNNLFKGGNFGKYLIDFNQIKNIQVTDFINEKENKEQLKQNLENIIRFIACLDYIKNCFIGQKIVDRPQMFMLLNGLYHTKSAWYDIKEKTQLNAFNKDRFTILNFDWKMDENKFNFICEKIKELTYSNETNNIFKTNAKTSNQNEPTSPANQQKLLDIYSPDLSKTRKREHSLSPENNTRKKQKGTTSPISFSYSAETSPEFGKKQKRSQ